MQQLVSEAIGHRRDAVDLAALAAQVRLFRSAALIGASQTAARSGPLMVWAGERALIFNEKCELILAKLTPEKYEEVSRVKVPLKSGTSWAHPAYADGCIFSRDDEEIVCVPLIAVPRKSREALAGFRIAASLCFQQPATRCPPSRTSASDPRCESR